MCETGYANIHPNILVNMIYTCTYSGSYLSEVVEAALVVVEGGALRHEGLVRLSHHNRERQGCE